LVPQEAFVRLVLFLSFSLALAGQTPAPDQQLTQTLISEIQQLRMAIERSTLLNARTQLAVSQLQLQEQSVARLTSQMDGIRTQAPWSTMMKARAAEGIKDLEQRRATTSDPKIQQQIEAEIKEAKFQLEQAASMETTRLAREGEISLQLQQAQSQIADSRSRIAEMERALDAAIQQMLKRP
jgi:hypothetical protein